jgi:hypothetical protein
VARVPVLGFGPARLDIPLAVADIQVAVVDPEPDLLTPA